MDFGPMRKMPNLILDLLLVMRLMNKNFATRVTNQSNQEIQDESKTYSNP